MAQTWRQYLCASKMEAHHVGCNRGDIVLMTGYIYTSLHRRHILSHYPIQIILKRIQAVGCQKIPRLCMHYIVHIYSHLILRIHLCTMFYQIFHDMNMSCLGCQMKCLFAPLKQSFTTMNALIGFITTAVRRPGNIRKCG